MLAGACLTIDLGALAENYRAICKRVAPSLVGGVIKADGYGLSARQVAGTLIGEGCRDLFVALLSEAAYLIPHVGSVPVYVLNGLLPGTEPACATIGAVPVLNSFDQVRRWAEQARASGCRLPAALQVDTGMSRMGLPSTELEALMGLPDLTETLDLRLLLTHLACADDPTDPTNRAQEAVFFAIANRFPGVRLSLDNSGGAFLPRGHLDLVRAGIALYGGAPTTGPNPMRAVASLESRIAQLRTIPPGTGVGYGLTFRGARETRIATVPVGYADGWPRCLGNRGSVYVAGHKVAIVGRVSMDSMTLDVTDVSERHLYAGAPVELLGPNQSIDQVAADAGTIAYEILTQLSRRYERVYRPAAAQRSEAA